MSGGTVKATEVDSIVDARGTPGAFKFAAAGDAMGLHFICPCGCGRQGYLPFRPESSPSWEWDGNREAPTLKPSVRQVGGCRWHGWLTAGEWSGQRE